MTEPADAAHAHLGRLRQPDGVTCGPTTVALARAQQDPTYAALLAADPDVAIRAEHQRLASSRGSEGHWRAPWPRALGTSPWSVADALGAASGRPHRTYVLPRRPTAALARVLHLLSTASRTAATDWTRAEPSAPGALYVGSRTVPRHVTLALGSPPGAPATLLVHDPAIGRERTLTHATVLEDPRLGGWPRWWLLVAPRE